ncbi:Type 1 phosphatases regulator ypi1 [Monascus purpureus]|uniref:Type 1 phosphatases regulator n=1 Tax=Monascus purpureus TaxID=5098 RepID=A0A507QLQ4_MONPU|nr:Type 1 phosphatases regulator ypi1 [Monascus purpureus]
MSQTRQATSNPAFASTRITSQTTSDSSHSHSSGLLRLRGEDTPNADEDIASARHIRWSEDVIDNEGKGKKSSKVCCIYHKSHPVGESSSESDSSDSDSDDLSDSDNETVKREGQAEKAKPECIRENAEGNKKINRDTWPGSLIDRL